MYRFRRFRLIAVVLGLVLVASACGGGDSSSDTSTTATPTTAGGGGGDAADTTTTTEAEPVAGDSGSTYCDLIRALEDEDAESPISFNFLGMTPEQLEAQFETIIAVYEEWADIAPTEIEEDVNILFSAFRALFERAKALNWNLLALADDPEFIGTFEDPAFETAANNIDAYTRDVCGVEFTTTADPGSAGPPATTDPGDDPIAIALNAFQLPAGLFSEDDIECLREEVGPEFEASITPGWIPGQEDIATLLAALDSCEIAPG